MLKPISSSTKPKNSIAVLGATGSIGAATLEVVRELGEPWHLWGASAHSRILELAGTLQDFQPHYMVATCAEAARGCDRSRLPPGCELLVGPDALVRLAQDPSVDTVVAAIVGSAGLMSTLAAAQAGKRLALANKETLVVAGGLVTDALRQSGGEMVPVDSEHSAIFQALQAGSKREVERIVLTASGGPFRTWTSAQMADASVEDALAHPTWQMGRKISIDSATMMNKALEVIEARWLFDLPADKISVVVHPQSIIHSFVEFTDGSVLAQLSPPDMRLPIQYALTYPDRIACPCPKMDWRQPWTLDLEPADEERFPALELGWEVAKRGGTCGVVVNAANEAAVELFLSGELRFPEIVAGCRRILDQHHYTPSPGLDELMRLDRWAREETLKWAAQC
ncbi:1-deoxy-D-xylulose-5-phosphate reductoisomerase [Aureliella helgolandensis]|uniref:1-deoxy-D-xylulose 5-phosphate reductoisomerase n=1 Tax=Aureliella helgolandensis TaxID=2527968 RepID=A0A518G442_9BACT|nr:1-deoxy-D-xylulose-5-phosphate reductoisomerase [Aureliella helgolandensis]QDV23330.1 1-deoxy-D-xylulose 5-phosphate reductoisomerase [Aureliella helgolandensis]